jgi:hypothetical protein
MDSQFLVCSNRENSVLFFKKKKLRRYDVTRTLERKKSRTIMTFVKNLEQPTYFL